MSSLKADVLVVGGGPAGSAAAFQLAGAGIAVTLVDRAAFPRDKVCGESLSPGALGRLQAIGMWPPADSHAVAHGLPVRGMRIRSPRGTTFLGRYKTRGSGPGLVIRRTVLDAQLLAAARERGVRVLEGVEAVAPEVETNRGVVRCRAVQGAAALRVEARRVIVADGRQSFLARSLGFIEEERKDARLRRFAVRVHYDDVSRLSEFAEMHVGTGGYCGLAPLSKTSANLCYVVFTDHLDLTPHTLETDVHRHLSAYPDISARLESAHRSGSIRVIGPLRIRSRRQAAGPFIACGDTTGFLDPFTGEGIAHAIASGVLGAEAVLESLHGRHGSYRDYERRIRQLRRVKGIAASLLYGLVSRRVLANAAGLVFAALPRLGDAAVRLFGDQV